MRPRSPRGRADRYECATRNRTRWYTRCSMRACEPDRCGRSAAPGTSRRSCLDLEETRRVIAEEHTRRNVESNRTDHPGRAGGDGGGRIARPHPHRTTRGARSPPRTGRAFRPSSRRHAKRRPVRSSSLLPVQRSSPQRSRRLMLMPRRHRRLAALREAVAGQVTSAEGLAAVREASSGCSSRSRCGRWIPMG